MRCSKCDYVLWNLKARSCPECGQPFQPDQYEFVPNGVQFCCPHCDQAYYGTTARGHLDPVTFTCVKCAQPVHMNDMVMRPASGIAESRAAQQSLPWLNSASIGRIKAFFLTCGWAMSSPTRVMRGIPEIGRAGAAWWFAFLVGAFSSACAYSTIAIPAFFISLISGRVDYDMLAAAILVPAGTGVSFLVLIAIWGLVAHGLLKITGPTAGGLGRTFAAICYGSGTMVAGAIPCLGLWFGYFLIIWWAISSGIMLAQAHRVSGRRAGFAAATVPTIMILSVVAMIFGSFVMAGQAFSQARQRATVAAQQANTVRMGSVLNLYAVENGDWPDHAARLVQDDLLSPWDFPSVQAGMPMPIGSTDLMLFTSLSPDEQDREIERQVSTFPKDMIAYRVGDIVFTYPGIDRINGDPGLWIAVKAPEAAGVPRELVAALLDGSSEAFAGEQVAEAIAAQNELRAAHGLAPLPDPATVTHQQPAVGE